MTSRMQHKHHKQRLVRQGKNTLRKVGKQVQRIATIVALDVFSRPVEQIDEMDSLSILDQCITYVPEATLKAIYQELQQELNPGKRKAIPSAVRKAVLERDHKRCVICKENVRLELHHIKFVSQGGTNTLNNLVTLCPNHHALVHADENFRRRLPKPRAS